MSQLENKLRRAIADLILGKLDLRAFATIVAQSIDAAGAEDARTHNLGVEIELRLAEYSNADWSFEELKGLLRPMVTSYSIERADVQVTGTDLQLTTAGSVTRSSVAIKPVAVPA